VLPTLGSGQASTINWTPCVTPVRLTFQIQESGTEIRATCLHRQESAWLLTRFPLRSFSKSETLITLKQQERDVRCNGPRCPPCRSRGLPGGALIRTELPQRGLHCVLHLRRRTRCILWCEYIIAHLTLFEYITPDWISVKFSLPWHCPLCSKSNICQLPESVQKHLHEIRWASAQFPRSHLLLPVLVPYTSSVL
jgi:hypothetical protein